MTDLWITCQHNMVRPHPVRYPEWCPGGHRATVEEVVEWLEGQPEAEQIRRAARQILGVAP